MRLESTTHFESFWSIWSLMVRQLGKGTYCAVTLQECTCITLDCSFLSHRIPLRARVVEHSRSTLSSVCCNLFDIVCQYVGNCLVDVDASDDQLKDRVALPCIPIFHSSLLSCHTVNTPTFERCLCPKEVDTLRFKSEIWNRVAGDLCWIRRVRTVQSDNMHAICNWNIFSVFLHVRFDACTRCVFLQWVILPALHDTGWLGSQHLESCWVVGYPGGGQPTMEAGPVTSPFMLIWSSDLYLILLAWKKQQARCILAICACELPISIQFNISSQ